MRMYGQPDEPAPASFWDGLSTDSAAAGVARLLTKGQGRSFDSDDIALMEGMLAGVPAQEAKAATVRLLKSTSRFITVADILAEVKRHRNAALKGAGTPPAPPSGLTASEYQAWLRRWQANILNGGDPETSAEDASRSISRGAVTAEP